MPKPLSVQSPYPTTEGLTTDAYSVRIISPAYATSGGELNAILQYVYHSFFFEKQGMQHIADTLVSIAICEMRHLEILGSAILNLGASPVFAQFPPSGFGFYSAKYVAYSCTLKNMLEDDILGERHSLASYERMLRCLKNEQLKNIISRIAEDEKLHLETLENILRDFKG